MRRLPATRTLPVVSGSGPLRPQVPDVSALRGCVVLRRVLRPVVRRPGVLRPVIIAWFAMALVLAGCGGPGSPESPSPGPGTSNGTPGDSTATANATDLPATADPTQGNPPRSTPDGPVGKPTAGGGEPPNPAPDVRTPGANPTKGGGTGSGPDWVTYTTPDGTLAFDLPASWKVEELDAPGPAGGVFIRVSNDAGKPMATLRTNIVTGSECIQRYPYAVMDQAKVPALVQGESVPSFIFESRDPAAATPGTTTEAAYGITSVPAPTGQLACPIFHLFTWPPSAAMFGAGYSPDNNVTPGDPSLPYLEKARVYAQTPEYAKVRTMITSLRPAG